MSHLQVSAIVPGPRSEVFDLLTNPEKLPQLLNGHIQVEGPGVVVPLRRGAEFQFNMTRFGFSQLVRIRIEDVLVGTRLTYRQSEGLFERWIHTTKFEDHGERQTLVTDIVDYAMPFGLFGYLADDLFVRRDMESVLQGRLKRAREFFETLQSDKSAVLE